MATTVWRFTGATAEVDEDRWEEQLDDFLDRLGEIPDATGVVGYAKGPRLGAVFCVDAPDPVSAAATGGSAFRKALEASGFDGDLERLEVEPFDEED